LLPKYTKSITWGVFLHVFVYENAGYTYTGLKKKKIDTNTHKNM